MFRSLAILSILSVGLVGCSLAPLYSRPEAPVSTNWPSGPAYLNRSAPSEAPAAAELQWREFFTDPHLQELIKLALDNNRDLRIAALNLEESRARFRIQRADLLPTLAAAGSAAAQRLPADLSPSGQAMIARNDNLGLGLSAYEIDLFGHIRSLKDQALAQFLASEQERHSVQISLVAEVANNYLTLAADRERLQLAGETLVSQQASYQLIQRRFAAGASSELDLRQAQTRVDAARVDVARYTSLLAQDENLLTLVVGAQLPPELLPGDFSGVGALRDLPPGVPSEVLLRRPDVLAAELQLQAANANIGAARAAFFPRILLNSSVGTASAQLSGLFAAGSLAWSFVPQFSLPIFDYGRNNAGLTLAERERDIFLARYEQAIQSAFREVADALAQNGTLGEQLQAQQSLLEASSESYRLSRVRYEKGVDSYLSVLDSQRALYAAQQGLISINLARLSNLVTLYKVLGGGSE
jgi:multidrug efflux system outer membrane protein